MGTIASPLDARYGGTKGMDTDDHTQRLYEMFTDRRLKAPLSFILPPCPNGVGWGVKMGPDFRTFPIRSGGWSLTGRPRTDDASRPDPVCGIRRLGPVVAGQKMFEVEDRIRGADNVSFEFVYVEGRKYEIAQEYTGGYQDIDSINTFVRIMSEVSRGIWSRGFVFHNNEVNGWLGIVLDAHMSEPNVRNNVLRDNHRGGLIFRYGVRNGYVSHNLIERSGDDAIAFNGNTDAYYAAHGPNDLPPKALNMQVRWNVLSEKQGQDIPEPPEGRKRTGNSPIAVRGGRDIYIFDNTITQAEDGYTDSDGKVWPAQPAVDVEDKQGQTNQNIRVGRLRILTCKGPGLRVANQTTTGSVNDAVIESFLGDCPWMLPVDYARSNLSPTKVCEVQ